MKKFLFILLFISQSLYSFNFSLLKNNQPNYLKMSQEEIFNYILSQTYVDNDNAILWIEKLYDFAKKTNNECIKEVIREILPYDIRLSKEEIIKKIKKDLIDLSIKSFAILNQKYNRFDENDKDEENDEEEFLADFSIYAKDSLEKLNPIFYSIFIDNEKLTKYFLDHSNDFTKLFSNEKHTSFFGSFVYCMLLGIGHKTLKLVLDFYPDIDMNYIEYNDNEDDDNEDYDDDDCRLIDYAIMCNYKDLVELLFTRFKSESYHIDKNELFDQPIVKAVELGLLDYVKFFVENGVLPNCYSLENEMDLVHLALENNFIDIARYLIDNGAYIEDDLLFFKGDLDFSKYLEKMFLLRNISSPLHIACLNGDICLVEELLKKGISPDIMDSRGRTPMLFIMDNLFYNNKEPFFMQSLWHQIENRKYFSNVDFDVYEQILDLLLKYGADVDARNNNADSALIICSRDCKDNKFISYLIRNGANTKFLNNQRVSFISNCIKNNFFIKNENVNVLELEDLLGRDALICLSIFYKFEDNEEKINFLLSGFDLNKKYYLEKSSVLHIAAANNNRFMVRYFVEKGIDVNIKNDYGYTPLFYAVYYGVEDIVKLLLELGADTSIKYIDGSLTVKDLAFARGHKEICELLSNYK